jgi:hypothetical protein
MHGQADGNTSPPDSPLVLLVCLRIHWTKLPIIGNRIWLFLQMHHDDATQIRNGFFGSSGASCITHHNDHLFCSLRKRDFIDTLLLMYGTLLRCSLLHIRTVRGFKVTVIPNVYPLRGGRTTRCVQRQRQLSSLFGVEVIRTVHIRPLNAWMSPYQELLSR